MEKVVLFGGGKVAKEVYKKCPEKIIAVIDTKKTGLFVENVPYISLDKYLQEYRDYLIWITILKYDEIVQILEEKGITNYEVPIELWEGEAGAYDKDIAHGNWPAYLKEQFDKPGVEILEVGSRLVSGDNYRELFTHANYTGFDYYEGPNVDVVGDAHKLSQYFDKKFDLIFSSAVFEHLAMPWQVSIEVIKLLKTNGYIFVESHYSYSSHERPWHFFQYSENALHVLFPEKFGIECVKKGCSNLIVNAKFSEKCSDYLIGRHVRGLYCHSEFLGKKMKEISDDELDWRNVSLEDVVGSTKYPKLDSMI